MKKRIIILSVILLAILLIIPLVSTAAKNLIMYNPENGRPVIVVGEETPEELVGKEVSLMIPADNKPTVEKDTTESLPEEEINVVSQKRNVAYSELEIKAQLDAYKEREKRFNEIMYKYHGTEKIDQVLNAMNAENGETDIITSYTFPESGKTLLRYVVEIFDTMNPLEEEKEVLREFSQALVQYNDINDDDLENRINNL